MKWSYPFGFMICFALAFMGCGTDDSPSGEENENQQEEVKPEDRLAQFVIDTNGGVIVDEPKIDADMVITKAEVEDYNGRIGIEIRGSSSQGFPKKSFGMETRDADNEDLDVSLLNYPEEEDWVLYGPYSDKSLIRNMLIYDLSRDIGRYASRTQFVELTLNGDYRGVYVFMEKLKRDKGRIAINNLKEDENEGEDLTGGYILKIDKLAGSNLGEGYNTLNSFMSAYAPPNTTGEKQIYFLYEEPDAEDITPAQKAYISTYVSNFEDALASEEFKDPDTGYAAYIDVDSFIDFFILNEISNNVDGYRLSTFMHKDKNGKLNMGPIWDFNLAFGNADYCGGGETNVWAYKFNERCPDDVWHIPFWWQRLLEDEAYVQRLKDRWSQLRGNELSNGGITDKIAQYQETLGKAKAIDRNFKKWPILGTLIWPNNFVGNTYEAEINYVETWIADRLAWLDTQIASL